MNPLLALTPHPYPLTVAAVTSEVVTRMSVTTVKEKECIFFCVQSVFYFDSIALTAYAFTVVWHRANFPYHLHTGNRFVNAGITWAAGTELRSATIGSCAILR
jgi:hypothetical protein